MTSSDVRRPGSARVLPETGTAVANARWGTDVISHGAVDLIASDAVVIASTTSITGSLTDARVGDVLWITSGALDKTQVSVIEVIGATLTLGQTLPSTPAGGDTYDILRFRPALLARVITSTPAGTEEGVVTRPIIGSLPLPSGAATSANQTNGSQSTQIIVDGSPVSSFLYNPMPITGSVTLVGNIYPASTDSTVIITASGQKSSSVALGSDGTAGSVYFYFGGSFAATHTIVFETTGQDQALSGTWYPFPMREVSDISNVMVTGATGNSTQRTFVGPVLGVGVLVRARCTAFSGASFSITMREAAIPYTGQYLPLPAGTNSIGQVTANAPKEAIVLVEASSTVTYVGKAPAGTATSAASWSVFKMDTTSGLIVTWADSNTDYDNIMDNCASLTYG